jgi:hypothetical protein
VAFRIQSGNGEEGKKQIVALASNNNMSLDFTFQRGITSTTLFVDPTVVSRYAAAPVAASTAAASGGAAAGSTDAAGGSAAATASGGAAPAGAAHRRLPRQHVQRAAFRREPPAG